MKSFFTTLQKQNQIDQVKKKIYENEKVDQQIFGKVICLRMYTKRFNVKNQVEKVHAFFRSTEFINGVVLITR